MDHRLAPAWAGLKIERIGVDTGGLAPIDDQRGIGCLVDLQRHWPPRDRYARAIGPVVGTESGLAASASRGEGSNTPHSVLGVICLGSAGFPGWGTLPAWWPCGPLLAYRNCIHQRLPARWRHRRSPWGLTPSFHPSPGPTPGGAGPSAGLLSVALGLAPGFGPTWPALLFRRVGVPLVECPSTLSQGRCGEVPLARVPTLWVGSSQRHLELSPRLALVANRVLLPPINTAREPIGPRAGVNLPASTSWSPGYR